MTAKLRSAVCILVEHLLIDLLSRKSAKKRGEKRKSPSVGQKKKKKQEVRLVRKCNVGLVHSNQDIAMNCTISKKKKKKQEDIGKASCRERV